MTLIKHVSLSLSYGILIFSLGQCKRADLNKPEHISVNLPFNTSSTQTWQIGYSKSNILSFNDFQLCTSSDTSDVIGMWHPGGGPAEYYPYVGQNRGKVSVAERTNGWAVRAGEIAMEGSNSGQYSMLRYVVPAHGTYKMTVTFEGVHYGPSSTDVHILVNSTPVFNDIIEGYGGDPAFHSIEGAHPVATYSDTIVLEQNDIITFAVGYGANKNHYGDTTGLIIDIEKN